MVSRRNAQIDQVHGRRHRGSPIRSHSPADPSRPELDGVLHLPELRIPEGRVGEHDRIMRGPGHEVRATPSAAHEHCGHNVGDL